MIDSNQEHFIQLRLEDFKRRQIIEDTELIGTGAYGVEQDNVKFHNNNSTLDLEVEGYDEGAAREYYFPLLKEDFNDRVKDYVEQKFIVISVGSDDFRTNMLMFDNTYLRHARETGMLFFNEDNHRTDDVTDAFRFAVECISGFDNVKDKKESYVMEVNNYYDSYKEELEKELEEQDYIEPVQRSIGEYTLYPNTVGMNYLFGKNYNVVKARGNIKLTFDELLKEQLKLIELNKELYGKNTL